MLQPASDVAARRRFALGLAVAVVAFALAAWLFGEIAEGIVEGQPLALLDAAIATALHAHATAFVTRAMAGISDAHRPVAIDAMAALVVLLLWRRRERIWAAGFVAGVAGGFVTNTLLKLAFHRARPHFDDPLVVLNTFGFPSGHTLGATVFYGMLCAYVLPRLPTTSQKIGVAALALVMVALVAMSRMYLGAHFLSDVLAAFCEGVAWVATCVAAIALLQRRS